MEGAVTASGGLAKPKNRFSLAMQTNSQFAGHTKDDLGLQEPRDSTISREANIIVAFRRHRGRQLERKQK